MPVKLEVFGRWHEGQCMLHPSVATITSLHLVGAIADQLCATAHLSQCMTAGSCHLWQAIIRVSHTSACTLGASQPNKKLCRYVTDKLTCWVQYCATHGFLSVLQSFLVLLANLWLYHCRQEGYRCISGTSCHTC